MLDALNFSLSVCIIIFLGNSRTWNFQVKVSTLQMPSLEGIQIGHETRTTQTNRLLEGVNHIVFMSNRWKKDHNLELSIFLKLWSNPFILLGAASIYGNVFGHNMWTTDPTFMFLSIFHHVSRCLIYLNHKKIQGPTQNLEIWLEKCVF